MGRGCLLLSDAVAKDLPRDLFLTHIEKRSSFLVDDEVDDLSSLSFVSLTLGGLRLLGLEASCLQFHIRALIQSGRGCLDERQYQNTTPKPPRGGGGVL